MNPQQLPQQLTQLSRRQEARRYPADADEFYRVLTNRNFHFVSPRAQRTLSELKVLIAGCGSGGGACVEPLARLGVTHLRIADSGSYELTNFNRQRAYVENIGQNKAEFHYENLRRLNPYIDAKFYPEGIAPSNVEELVRWADVIFDCVDVTTQDAMAMKLRLHELAHQHRKPTFFCLDLGFCQTGGGYDYRDPSSRPLGGKLEAARATRNSLKALFTMFPISKIPDHVVPLAEHAFAKKPLPISQLGCASDLLSAVAAAALIRYAENGEVVRHWEIDLVSMAMPGRRGLGSRIRGWLGRRRLKALMRRLP